MKILDYGRAGGTAMPGDDDGCAYILNSAGGGAGGYDICGARRRPGSAYCAAHHALCHIPGGSPAERRRLRETEALAEAVGGRRGRPARLPPEPFLRRLEQVARVLPRPQCSCYVRKREARR